MRKAVIVEIKSNEHPSRLLGSILAMAKIFSTGSNGFYGNDKILIDGAGYQVGISLVRIGSKPKPKTKKKTAKN